jgi:branched-chain amino acid transport system substrate-binding protein
MRNASDSIEKLGRRTAKRLAMLACGSVALLATAGGAVAAEYYIPVVVPVTGFLSVEGGSQRNGAVMALENPPEGVQVRYEVYDTTTSPTGGAQAMDQALSAGDAIASAVSVFGTETVAMVPVGTEYGVPMLTISGLSTLTESGNPWVFRFLPNDREIKVAHARYVVEELKKTKPALIGDTTSYGQGGFALLKENFAKLGVTPAFEDSSIAPDTKDMSPLLTKIKESGADSIVIHTIGAPMFLIIKQAKAAGIDLPLIVGSSIVEPTATVLFEPAELGGVCAETPSAPEARATPKMKEWADAYMAKFNQEPDGLALGQYDGVMMALQMIANGATTAEEMRDALASSTYEGVAMTYKSSGGGDMAHDADIVCYDGKTRIPVIAKHYSGEELVLK